MQMLNNSNSPNYFMLQLTNVGCVMCSASASSSTSSIHMPIVPSDSAKNIFGSSEMENL